MHNRKQTVHHKAMRSRGFTIVELLIVIVVIAILAAISIVAYTGIQQRAYVSKVSSVVNTTITTLELYRAEHGSYPSTGDDNTYDGDAYVCIGTLANYPETDQFDAGVCDTAYDDSVDELFNVEILQYINSIPNGSVPSVPSAYAGFNRGVSYGADDSNTAYVYYQITGGQDCPIGRYVQARAGTIACQVNLRT